MTPTSQMITGQLATLDANATALRARSDALALGAVTGDKSAAEELARIKSEIAGLVADREVLVAAKRRAEVLEADADEDAGIEDRRAHRAEAQKSAAAALAAARDMDAAIAAFVAAAAALDAAEKATRDHVRLAGDTPDGRVGRKDAAGHGHFLIARVVDGTAKRRNDRTVAELVGAAWQEYLEKEPA